MPPEIPVKIKALGIKIKPGKRIPAGIIVTPALPLRLLKSLAVRVVLLAFFRVGENLVSFVHFLKFFRIAAAGLVRMVLMRHFAVSFFNLFRGSGFVNA